MHHNFSDYIPGTWSSHPVALRRQRIWLFLAGLMPIIVLGVIAVVSFTELDTWKTVIQSPLLWIKVVVSVFCMSMGAIFTLTMLNMVSRTLGRTGGMKGRDELPFPVWVVVVGAFFWLVPMGLTFFREKFFDPAYIGIVQFVLNIMCFAPFVLILFWILLARNPDELKDRTRRSKLLGLFWTVFLGLAILSLLGDAHAALSHWSVSARWIQGLHKAILRLILFATLFPLSVICFALWQLVRLKPKVKKEKKDKSFDQPSDEALKVEQLPWLKELCGHLPAGIRVEENNPQLVSLSGTSAIYEGAGEGWLLLTGGKKPTEDQWQFLERFRRAYRDAFEESINNCDPKIVQTRADILLQGTPGSGRTEALCAVALYASLVRGQHVLFVVSDNEQARILQERLDGRLREMFLDCYVWCGVLSKSLADGWLMEKADAQVPDILFATPENIERWFFANNTTIERTKLLRLREVTLSFDVVLVDDFMDFDVTERSHLAFIIDKLRLLLISERVVPQFVVATPKLQAPECVEQLGERLFGLRNFDRNNNVLLLRPRPCAPFWELNLRVETSASEERAARMKMACRDLVTCCREKLQLSVLFYQKGIGENARKDLEHDLGGQNGGGRLRVISKLDGALEGDAPPDAVFYLSVVSGNMSIALRLASDEGKAVYVRIAAEDELEFMGDVEKTLLIPDESAVPLRLAHLRSVLGFIDPLTPIDASVWSYFGISLTHPQIREEPVCSDSQSPVLLSWLHDEWLEEVRYPIGHLWPYLVLEQATTASVRGQPVNLRVLPQSREAIFKTKDASRILLGRLAKSDLLTELPQLAIWKDKRGNRDALELEMDLAHAEKLLLKTDDDLYSAASLEAPSKSEADRFALSITAQYNRGDGSDFEIPVRSFCWRALPSFRAEDIWQVGGVAGFVLTNRNGEFCRMEGSLDASMNLFGEERKNTPRAYSYPVHLSGLLLSPTLPDDSERAPESIRASVNGRWHTRAQTGFSPVLTHAFTAVLRRRLDGWSFFVLAPVFMISGREGGIGEAIIWLAEPVNSGRTVYPVIKMLLQNRDFRQIILKEVREELERVATLSQLRQESMLAFTDETLDEDDRAQARRLLDNLLSGTPPSPVRVPSAESGGKPAPLPIPKRIYREQYTEQEKEFDSLIVAGLLAFQDSLDVTKFAVEYGWSEERICETLNDVLWNNPQVFYVSKSHKYQWWTDASGTITRFLLLDFQYGIEKSEFALRKAEIDRAAAEALEKVKTVSDPAGKARALHDHIIAVCEYDTDAADMDDISPLARTAYSALVRHKAVCEGYAMAYRYLLGLANIESEEIVSEAMKHCWNYVRLGDHWYHVDVTHDDPVYYGRKADKTVISHEYFLLSDAALQTKGHHNWNPRGLPPAGNMQYDGRSWNG